MPSFESKNIEREAPESLKKVYAAKERRTVDLVKISIDALVKENQQVSLSAIVAKSKEFDSEARGVSISAIQRNELANTYYKQYRNYEIPRKKQLASVKQISPKNTFHVKLDRELGRVRRRYLKLSKGELVDKLITIEQALAEQEERWHQCNDNLLIHHLSSECGDSDFAAANDTQEANQELNNSRIKRLNSQNQELKAQLFGMNSLITEIDELKKEKQRLFNKVIQFEAAERDKAARGFAAAISNNYPEIPEVEY